MIRNHSNLTGHFVFSFAQFSDPQLWPSILSIGVRLLPVVILWFQFFLCRRDNQISAGCQGSHTLVQAFIGLTGLQGIPNLISHYLPGQLCGKRLGLDVESVSHSVVYNSLQTLVLYSSRLLCPWNFPGKNTGMCSEVIRGEENLPTCQCKRHKRCEVDPWIGKIPWKRS